MASQGRGDGRRRVTEPGALAPVSLFDRLDLAALRRAVGGLTDPVATALGVLVSSGAIAHDALDPEWPDRDRLVVASSLVGSEVARVLGERGGIGEAVADEDALDRMVAVARAGRASGVGARIWGVLPASALLRPAAASPLVEVGDGQRTGLMLLLPSTRANALLCAAGWTVTSSSVEPLELVGAVDRALDGAGRPQAIVLDDAD